MPKLNRSCFARSTAVEAAANPLVSIGQSGGSQITTLSEPLPEPSAWVTMR